MPQSRKLISLLAASLLFTAGCNLKVHTSGSGHESEDSGNHSTRTETKSIDKDKAEMVKVELEMGAGELNLSGGAAKLFEGRFEYNRDAFKPEVRYEGSNFRGTLAVKHAGGSASLGGDVKNTWDLKVANDVPLDISVKIGAGESKLRLGDVSIRNLEVNLGAGSCDVDLRGKPTHSYEVKMRGGVGEATVRVPADVGVYAEAKGGLGEIKVRGLEKDGDAYKNAAYGKSKNTIRLDIKGGIGQINIYSE